MPAGSNRICSGLSPTTRCPLAPTPDMQPCGSRLRMLREGRLVLLYRFQHRPDSAYSNAKMCFQSFFMLITVQPLLFASAMSAGVKVPTLGRAGLAPVRRRTRARRRRAVAAL